jgi:lipopolysaccharide transport system permease protein
MVSHVHTTTIEPDQPWWKVRWDEIVSNRELLFFFVWRDLKVRYKQTALGVVWAVLQPLSAMIVFSIFFGRLAKIQTGGIPYPLFAYTGTLLWQFFARALSEASTALAANERLITRVYFPRIYIPLSVILAAVVDLGIAFVVALLMLAFYGYYPHANILLMPFVVLMVIVAALGVGLLFSAFDVRYRDVRYVLPFLSQVWMFASPVVYPSSLVPPQWRALYALNPMVGFLEGFRYSLLGGSQPPWAILSTSSLSAVGLLVVGLIAFQKVERRMTDIV